MAITFTTDSVYYSPRAIQARLEEYNMATSKKTTAVNSAVIQSEVISQLNRTVSHLQSEVSRLNGLILAYAGGMKLEEIKSYTIHKASQVGLVPPDLNSGLAYLNWLDNNVWRLQAEGEQDVLAD